jgi:hypothetical protein
VLFITGFAENAVSVTVIVERYAGLAKPFPMKALANRIRMR